MKYLLISIAIFCMAFTVQSQSPHFILSEFFVYQEDNVVRLQWTIKEGNTCNGIDIERGGEQKSFEKIGHISGVCGAPDQSVTYRYVDSLPMKNRVNYYRLELGTQGYSSPVKVETRFYSNGEYVVKGNPARSNMTILFKNENSVKYTFRIFDTQGNLVREFTTRNDRLDIPVSELSTGVYIFQTVSTRGSGFTGKFAVL
ncbi:MAG: T9SS type A sorting domain-containing protein [Bacteroidales bacterium]|nr:T9SS type A sorting domain-containing protein [Bacteroidales bacterium]MCF8334590.1 T9SS type A sorting domain-containing protein [Bacteroidales bacterium]